MRMPLVLAAMVGGLTVAVPTMARPAEECRIPDGWAQVVRSDPRYVVFGEIHGTQQSPAFIGNLACALAMRGERALVAVELGSIHDAALQAAWLLPHKQFPAALVKNGWAGQNDGVGSVAMRDMLVRLHALKDAGRPIAVVAFNGARDATQRTKFADQPGQGPHEAAQAENIRNAANAGRYDRVLVLVGNLHARKQPVERQAATFRPMAMQLAPAGTVVSLDMATAGGASWSCQLREGIKPSPGTPLTREMMDCAGHPLRGDATIDRAPFITLQPLPGATRDPAYDGSYWLGPVSASPPAVAGD